MNSEQNNLGGNASDVNVTNPPLDGPVPSPALESPVTPEATPNETAPVEMPDAPVAPTPETGGSAPELVVEPMPGAETITPYSEPAPEPPKKKNKVVTIIIAVVAVLVLAIGGYAIYLFFLVSPAKVHDKLIGGIFDSASEFVLSAKEETDYDSFRTQGSLKLETNVEEFELINDYSLSYVVGMDMKNSKMEMGLTLTEEEKEILNAMLYYLEETMYLEAPELWDNIINLGEAAIDFSEYTDTQTIDDLNTLILKVKEYLLKSFDDEKYTRKLESVTFNGKKQSAFNNSYAIDEATMYTMLRNFLTSCRNDQDFVGLLATYGEVEVSELNSALDALIETFTDPEVSGNGGVVYINAYTSMITNKLIGVKIYADDTLILDHYKDGGRAVTTIGDGTTSIVITKTDKLLEFKVTSEGEEIIFSVTKESETKSIVAFSVPVTSEALSGTIKLNITSEVKESGKNEEATANIVASLVTDADTYEIKIDTTATTEYDVSIADVSTSGADNYEDVDEEELMTNFLESIEGTNIYAILESLLATDDSYYDDYYEDDYSEITVEDPNCLYAFCEDCVDEMCECTYYDDNFDEQPVMCPNPNL